MRRCVWIPFVALLLISGDAWAWPNEPSENPCLAMPNDPGYSGQWNLWSFVPGPHMDEACPEWTRNDWTAAEGFRQEEIALGSGIHADRAWQITPGDRRVIVAVLDSGVYWDNKDLVNKYYLNRGELANCMPSWGEGVEVGEDPFDVDGSKWLDIRDYYAALGEEAELANWDENQNGMLDPQDLIMKCSDGVDDDGNGYVDDISGWDFFADDNDAYDDNRFGHGNGEARWSVAEGNNGKGDIGVCPECTALMLRAADSFIADANEFAHSVIFAVDSGAHVIQEALGSVNNTPLGQHAINYAYMNNVVVIASAADELSYHHNMPGTNNHTVYVHATVYDAVSADQSTTFLNFNNCTNFGMQLLLSTPGTGCSSEATGITAGHAGLMYSAALKAELDPPLSAEEVKQLLTMNVDDINANPDGSDLTKFPSREGWDWHFGYGRNNARKTVDAIVEGRIPPEVDILEPLWFQVLYPDRTPTIDITGRINLRTDGRPARYESVDWTMEYAVGVAPTDDTFIEISSGTTEGLEGVLATWDLTTIDLDLDAQLSDPHQNAVTLRLKATGTLEDGSTISGEMRKGFLVERDPDLHPGFPIYLGTSGESSPTFADLDGDGAEDIVAALADGMLHAWKYDGTEVAGFPVALDLRWSVHPDNDLNSRNACAYREDKTGCVAELMTLDPEVARHTLMMAPGVGDLDADGTLEIVLTTWDGWVYVFEHDGSSREGWPQSVDFTQPPPSKQNLIEFGFFAAPTLYDLDADGDLEILAPGMDQNLYVWNHDGSTWGPYPVKVGSDPEQGARIIASVAVGDADGDGLAEIAVGTSETFGAAGNANETLAYLLESESGEVVDGWPASLYGLTVETLPIVGRGVVSNPIMADLDYDGTLELSFDTISSPGILLNHDGTQYKKMDNKTFGEKSDSADTPAYILHNHGAMGNIDGSGGIDLVKGTAGFDFAIAFAGGGERKPFDHHMSGWDTDTGKMMEGFPRVHDDWQFFNTPSIVDINNDNKPEVIIGSGGYLVRAWNYLGEEPEGWPKQTGGWIIASAGIGDFDGDGNFDVTVMTRDGWLYAWKTEGKAGQSLFEWNGFNHDPHNTGNYETSPTPYKTWSGEVVAPEPEPEPEPTPEADAESSGEEDISTGPSADDAGPATAVERDEDEGPSVEEDEGCQGGRLGTLPLALLMACALMSLLLRRRRSTL